MVLAGMDVARLNFSHGDADAHRQAGANVREAAEAAGRPVALLGDRQGPKIRTGRVEGTFQRLVRGRVVTLVGGGASAPTRASGATSPQGGEVKLELNQIQVSHEELVQALRPGDRVLLDDGRIELAVRAVSDGQAEASVVRVGRGDLGVELKLGDLPAVQKDVIDRANRAGVPVITATEMLESMVTSNRPTRAEASDVANAIWDGTDAVMLSQETSIGAHPVEAVRAMARICQAAQKHPAYERARQFWREPGQVGSAIAHAAASTAAELQARVIIAFTESGTTALRCSKARPGVPIIAASPHPEVLRRTALYSGVVPLLVSPGRDTDEMIANATEAAVQSGMVRPGDRVVVVAGVPVGRPGQTNLLKVETV